MRRFGRLVFFAAAILLAGGARADQVTIRRSPPYAGVTVTDVKDGSITFRLPSGNVTKPLAEVEIIQIDRQDAFNRAEKLQADPNMTAAALRAYEEAAGTMAAGWQGRLLSLRRLAAAERAGLIDQAVRDWLAAMDESAVQAVIDLRPKLADKITGGPAAITTLETKLTKVKAAPYVSAIKGLLLRLYEKEGQKEKVNTLAAELSGGGPTPAAAVSGRDQLRGLQVRLEAGEAAAVLGELEKELPAYGEADLPRALLLVGKARLKLAEAAATAADKKKQLVAGGLALMRVYAYYPKSADAAEALYLAGQSHAMLPQPNATAAAAAYQKVIQEYASSPFAASAKDALAKVKK